MQLVTARPIPGSIMRSGGWYEDFAKTGAKTSGLIGGVQTAVVPSEWGIKLEPSIDSASIQMPVRLSQSYTDFEAEWVCRGYGTPSASTDICVSFRQYDTANRFYVSRTGSGNSLKIVRALGNVYTTLATVTGIPFSSWVRTGLRVVGPNIEVFNDGRRIISLTDAAHMRLGGIRYIYNYDPTPGVARGEWQYIAIRPLGFNPFVVQDSFNRADGAIGTADSGQVWVSKTGTMSVASGVVTNTTANARCDIDALVSDTYEVGARFRFLTSAGTDRRAILQLRCLAASGGADDLIEVTLNRSSQDVQIATRTAGALTSLGNVAYTVADNTDYWMKVRVVGQSIEVLIGSDGITYSSVLTRSSALYTSQTGIGIRLNDSAGSTQTLIADDLTVRRLH